MWPIRPAARLREAFRRATASGVQHGQDLFLGPCAHGRGDDLAAAQEELASQARSIDRLEQQVNTYQMQGAQNEQSLRELQEENLRLVDENADYATQIDALNAQLSKLNSRVSTLQDSNAALQQKSAFFDAHVAFVENDGTDYYHNYSCSYFKKQSYWAYSVNLAIARGYTACPYCGG